MQSSTEHKAVIKENGKLSGEMWKMKWVRWKICTQSVLFICVLYIPLNVHSSSFSIVQKVITEPSLRLIVLLRLCSADTESCCFLSFSMSRITSSQHVVVDLSYMSLIEKWVHCHGCVVIKMKIEWKCSSSCRDFPPLILPVSRLSIAVMLDTHTHKWTLVRLVHNDVRVKVFIFFCSYLVLGLRCGWRCCVSTCTWVGCGNDMVCIFCA